MNEREALAKQEKGLVSKNEMESARELYASLGFEEVAPYYFNPIPGAHYLKAALT